MSRSVSFSPNAVLEAAKLVYQNLSGNVDVGPEGVVQVRVWDVERQTEQSRAVQQVLERVEMLR